MNENNESKNKKQAPITKLIYGFLKTLIPPLSELNTGLRTLYHLTEEEYFKLQIRRNYLFRFISYVPIFMAYFVLYKSIVHIDIFKPQFQELMKGIKFKNLASIGNKIPEDFYYYCSYTLTIFAILFLVSAIIILFVKNTHPLLRDNKTAKRVFLSKGVLKDKNAVFVHTPRGVLLEYEGDIDSVIKNNELWKILDRHPREPIRDPDNKNLYFIGYGFKLRDKYIFEFQE